MANERNVRVEVPLSNAISTEDDVTALVSRFQYPCEVIASRNGRTRKVMHCNVLAPTNISEHEIRDAFRELINKIENHHKLKGQAKHNLAKQKGTIAKIGRGLKNHGKNGER